MDTLFNQVEIKNVLLFQSSPLDGNKWTCVCLQFSNLMYNSPTSAYCAFCQARRGGARDRHLCILGFVFLELHVMPERASTIVALQEIHSSLSLIPNSKTTSFAHSRWPAVPVSLCSVAPSVLFQISGAAKHSVRLYCALFGRDYISLSMHVVFCSLVSYSSDVSFKGFLYFKARL